MSKKFLYELHCHTNVSSRCSKFTPEEIIEFYTKLKYDGIFITDHFYHSCSNVSEETSSVEERIVNAFKGFNQVKELAKNTTLKVFCGVEYNVNGCDFLVFGLDESWYLNHPELYDMDAKDGLIYLKNNGAFIIQPHPFSRAYSGGIFLYPDFVDGFEVNNACRSSRRNKLALELAKAFNKYKVCGSDIHVKTVKKLCAMVSKTPINNENEFIESIKQNKFKFKVYKNPLI